MRSTSTMMLRAAAGLRLVDVLKSLEVQGSSHGLMSDYLTLTEHSILTIFSSVHLHTSGGLEGSSILDNNQGGISVDNNSAGIAIDANDHIAVDDNIPGAFIDSNDGGLAINNT